MFYDRLHALNLTNTCRRHVRPISLGNGASNDYALANTWQVKYVFQLRFGGGFPMQTA